MEEKEEEKKTAKEGEQDGEEIEGETDKQTQKRRKMVKNRTRRRRCLWNREKYEKRRVKKNWSGEWRKRRNRNGDAEK